MLQKDTGAFLTIGEVSARFGIAAHILRYWETKFARLRPLQRAGNRRYYRPEDVAMVDQINTLLNKQGYTVNGAVKLLAKRSGETPDVIVSDTIETNVTLQNHDVASLSKPELDIIRNVRDRLASALAAA